MKSKKYMYIVVGITALLSFVSINSLFVTKEKYKKSNVISNYDKNIVTDECKNSNGVKSTSNNLENEIKILPVPNTNEPIIFNTM